MDIEAIILLVLGAVGGVITGAALFIGNWFGNKFKALEEKVAASPTKIDDALLNVLKDFKRDANEQANAVIKAKLEDPKTPLGQ